MLFVGVVIPTSSSPRVLARPSRPQTPLSSSPAFTSPPSDFIPSPTPPLLPDFLPPMRLPSSPSPAQSFSWSSSSLLSRGSSPLPPLGRPIEALPVIGCLPSPSDDDSLPVRRRRARAVFQQSSPSSESIIPPAASQQSFSSSDPIVPPAVPAPVIDLTSGELSLLPSISDLITRPANPVAPPCEERVWALPPGTRRPRCGAVPLTRKPTPLGDDGVWALPPGTRRPRWKGVPSIGPTVPPAASVVDSTQESSPLPSISDLVHLPAAPAARRPDPTHLPAPAARRPALVHPPAPAVRRPDPTHPPAAPVTKLTPHESAFARRPLLPKYPIWEAYFRYNEEHRILVCRDCQVAVWMEWLPGHLRDQHGITPAGQRVVTASLRESGLPFLQSYAEMRALAESLRDRAVPPPPVPGVLVRRNGFRCRAPKDMVTGELHDCHVVYGSLTAMKSHVSMVHGWKMPTGRSFHLHRRNPHLFAATAYVEGVSHQQLSKGGNVALFEVDLGEPPVSATRSSSPPSSQPPSSSSQLPSSSASTLSLGERIRREGQSRLHASSLAFKEARAVDNQFGVFATSKSHPLVRSPWLLKTRWETYLGGYMDRLPDVARLANLDYRFSDPVLHQLLIAADDVIEDARRSIRENRVSVFALSRLNSFYAGRDYRYPLRTSQTEKTFIAYKRTWKQMITAIYHLAAAPQETAPRLPFSLLSSQQSALDELMHALRDTNNDPLQCDSSGQEASVDVKDLLMKFILSLLDDLDRENIHDSILIAALAVLGVSPVTYRLHDVFTFGSALSAIMRMIQFTVISVAVRKVELGEAETTAIAVKTLHSRFLHQDSSSPVAWLMSIRGYSSKARRNRTVESCIRWSDDDQEVSYKESCHVHLHDLRWFLHDQVSEMTHMLYDLLLLPLPDGETGRLPSLDLKGLKDSMSKEDPGWCFLNHAANKAVLQKGESYILNRVCNDDALVRRFVRVREASGQPVVWRKEAMMEYAARADRFLERLLLLVHMTSGQPARGTELMTLQWRNTDDGLLRNMFLEDGRIVFVTAYHKGYAIMGSTKIIQRYIPPSVSRLVVYYLWLVVPFLAQLRILACGDAAAMNRKSSLFWGAFRRPNPDDHTVKEEPWDAKRLTEALKREFTKHLGTPMALASWRHIAIAISRKHLVGSEGFKRDFDNEARRVAVQETVDNMAGHTSNIAALNYARGMDLGIGLTDTNRLLFRHVSLEWQDSVLMVGSSSLAPRTDEWKSYSLPVYSDDEDEDEEMQGAGTKRWRDDRDVALDPPAPYPTSTGRSEDEVRKDIALTEMRLQFELQCQSKRDKHRAWKRVKASS